MSRNDTESRRTIRMLCKLYGLNEKRIYKESKNLLEIFRGLCWNILDTTQETKEDLLVYTGTSDLDGALICLEQFASDYQKELFENRIISLIRDRNLMSVAEMALEEVKKFPNVGNTYYDILEKAYFDKNKHSEMEMLDIVNLERSRFYDRKREAVVVYGLMLWGKVMQSDSLRTLVGQ